LLDLRDGATEDAALQAIYGFNVDGLDDAWRHSIGAAAHAGSSTPTQALKPTEVPTYIPVGAATAVAVSTPPVTPLKASSTPAATLQRTSAPTPSPVPSVNQPGLNPRNFTTRIEIGLAGLVIAVLLVGLVILLMARRKNRSGK
jgi:hypothetical protein